MNRRNAENVAAYLAHPFLDMPNETQDFSTYEIKSIYAFLRRNRVILRTMNLISVEESDFSRKNSFLKEIVVSSRLFAEAYDFALYQKKRCVELVRAMTAGGIDLIFIKSSNEFPLDSHNFDVLVKEKDLAPAKQVLESLGYRELVQIREPFKWFYRKVEDNLIVSVHLHIRVAWEGVEFVDSEAIWDRHREESIENLKVGFPSPEHQLLITVAHAFFENQSLKLCDLLSMVDAIWISDHMDWTYIADWCIQSNWLHVFHAFLKLANYAYESCYGESLLEENIFKTLEKRGKIGNSDLSNRLILQFAEKKRLPVNMPTASVGLAFVKKVFRTPQGSVVEKVRKVGSTGLHYVRRRMPLRTDFRALVICFSGQDGAGKTTHAKVLQDRLERMIRITNDELMEKNLRIKYVWSRGIGLTVEPLLRIVRRLMLGQKSADIENYSRKRQDFMKKEPVKTLWAYVTLVDEILQLITKVKIPLMLGHVIICDRYVYDVFVDVKCELNKNVNWATKEILTKMLPQPELRFIADAPLKEIIKRKEDLDLDIIHCKSEEYLDYLRSPSFILIDTSRDFGQTSQDVMSTVLETLMF